MARAVIVILMLVASLVADIAQAAVAVTPGSDRHLAVGGRQLLKAIDTTKPQTPRAAAAADTSVKAFARLPKRLLLQKANPTKPTSPKQPSFSADSANEAFSRLPKRLLLQKANPTKPTSPKQPKVSTNSVDKAFSRLAGKP